MTEIQIIIFILAGACAVWQISLVVLGAAMMRTGQYRTVKIGLLPTILGLPLLILAVLL